MVIIPLAPVMGVVWFIAKLALYLSEAAGRRAARKAEEQKRAETIQRLRTRMEALRDGAMAAAIPGPQRDEIQYWYSQAIPAYLNWRFNNGGLPAYEIYRRAEQTINLLREARVVNCPTCGARDQLAGRDCGYCGKMIPLARPA